MSEATAADLVYALNNMLLEPSELRALVARAEKAEAEVAHWRAKIDALAREAFTLRARAEAAERERDDCGMCDKGEHLAGAFFESIEAVLKETAR